MQNLKMKLKQCTQQYVEKERGREHKSNLTPEQKRGLASLIEKRKEKEIVIFETDKSKRFSCDTMDNYQLLGTSHTAHDEIISAEDA